MLKIHAIFHDSDTILPMVLLGKIDKMNEIKPEKNKRNKLENQVFNMPNSSSNAMKARGIEYSTTNGEH